MKTVIVNALNRRDADNHIDQHHAGEGLLFDKVIHVSSVFKGKTYRYKQIELTEKQPQHGQVSKLS